MCYILLLWYFCLQIAILVTYNLQNVLIRQMLYFVTGLCQIIFRSFILLDSKRRLLELYKNRFKFFFALRKFLFSCQTCVSRSEASIFYLFLLLLNTPLSFDSLGLTWLRLRKKWLIYPSDSMYFRHLLISQILNYAIGLWISLVCK